LAKAMADFWGEIKDGLSYIRSNQIIWQAMLKLALLFSAVVATCILAISYSKTFLYLDPKIAASKFAYIIAVSGIGMALGATLVGKPLRNAPRPWLVFSGMFLVGMSLMAWTFVDVLYPEIQSLLFRLPAWHIGPVFLDVVPVTERMGYTYFWAALTGVGASLVSIPLQSLLHERIPEDKRGKVLGVQFTILSTCSTLPVLLAGLGTDVFGVIPMLTAMALPFLIVGTIGLKRQCEQKHHCIQPDW
jgi:MFS family permease